MTEQATTIRLRRAVAADAPAIWKILRPVFRAGDTYTVDPEISEHDAIAYWTRSRAYVAEAGGEILGTCYLRPNQPGGGAHVCNAGFATARGAEGRGVARAMLAHALEEAAALGFEAMQFNFVLETNLRALRLWQRAGFRVIGRQPRAFRLPDGRYTDALILHKFLSRESRCPTTTARSTPS